MGGLAASETTSSGYRISGCSCPLAAILPGNPEACRLAAFLLEELVGAQVRECCQREDSPRCQFEIKV
jgi:predicted ArsR family transcriptional regulator